MAETYKCTTHHVEIDVDRQHRVISCTHQGPVPGCVLLRRGHELIEHEDRLDGDHGPYDPRTGQVRCHVERVK